MYNAIANWNGKIWLFWNGYVRCVVKYQDDQQNTCNFSHNEIQMHLTMTLVYAKCKEYLRRPLWYKILLQAELEDKPWCSLGEYNVITSTEKKIKGHSIQYQKMIITSTEETLGGISYNIRKCLDFIAIEEACVLIDIGFICQKSLGIIIVALINGYGKVFTGS